VVLVGGGCDRFCVSFIEWEFGRAHRVLERLDPGRAGEGDHVRPAREQPREGDAGRCRLQALGRSDEGRDLRQPPGSLPAGERAVGEEGESALGAVGELGSG